MSLNLTFRNYMYQLPRKRTESHSPHNFINVHVYLKVISNNVNFEPQDRP